MIPTKPAFGLVFSLLPILYVGGLLWYFVDFTGGSFAFASDIGLGQTKIGLAVIGLLLFIPLVWRMLKAIQGPTAGGSEPRKPGPSDDDDNGGFDADAVIAKYLVGRPLSTSPSASQSIQDQHTRAGGTVFGRRSQ